MTITQGTVKKLMDFNEKAKEILKIVPLYYDNSKIWYKWNPEKYCWEKIDEIDILNSVQEELQEVNICQNHIKSQIITALQMESRKLNPKPLSKTQIQFKNEIIDLKTGEVIEATSEYFTFNSIPWEIGMIEDTPNMDKFIKSWVGEENLTKVQEWIAYNMLTDYPIHRITCMNGSGSNGKSTLIKLMRKIIGEHNLIGGELDTVFLERFGLSYLHRKTGIVMGETNFQKLTRTGKFKSATGQDPLIIEYKGKIGFDYVNYAKVTICTNSLPITWDKTDGFYRRWLIINFPNKFQEKVDVLKKIPEKEYSNFCRKSIRLLKGILNRGGFTNEGDIEERRKNYERISNPLDIFLKEKITDNYEECITRKEFGLIFKAWLKENKYRILSDKEIVKLMSEYYTTRWDTGERVWIGITWKTKDLNSTNTSMEVEQVT